jgi:multimeric flavodoxin WrbA
MTPKHVVILDGAGSDDADLSPVLSVLSRVLEQDEAHVRIFPLREMKLAHCLGCFGCWMKTPGMCVEADAGREIARAVIQSDMTVFFTPVTFGGYSPELKRMLDRFIQLISPYFKMDHREVHHPPRYTHRPRLMMVGVQRSLRPNEALIFKTLAGRNAINFHPPSYAAEVVLTTDDTSSVEQRFRALLTRSDALPFGEAAARLMPPPVEPQVASEPTRARRALLIVGSPKAKPPMASNILGSYVLKRLNERGWDTEILTLHASVNRPEGQAELLASVDRAGLIVLAFPLYADALPYLVTKALSVVADHRRSVSTSSLQRLAAIVNSGFPETHQNAVALAICREFAAQSGFAWAGGLALPAGGMVGSEPLWTPKRSGPPLKHVIAALDSAAIALADGQAVPAEAIKLITKNPVPLVPFALWRWIYMLMAGKGFEKEAAKHGVSKDQLLAQPYAA